MFFVCFWVVLSCSVFVQNKTFKNPQKSFLNLVFFQTWALHRPLQRAGSVEQSGSNTRETVACHCGDWKRTYLQHDKHPLLRRFCESGAVIQDSRPTYLLTYDRHGFSRERPTKRRRLSCEAGKQASTRWRQEATEDVQRARAAMTHWPEQYAPTAPDTDTPLRTHAAWTSFSNHMGTARDASPPPSTSFRERRDPADLVLSNFLRLALVFRRAEGSLADDRCTLSTVCANI